MLFSRKKRHESDVSEAAESASSTGEAESPAIDAELSLCALRASKDPGRTLHFFDTHFEEIDAQGYLDLARQIVVDVEADLDEETWKPGSIAMLASLRQRFALGDSLQGLRRSVDLYQRALQGYEQDGEATGAAIVRNNLGNALVDLAPFEPVRYRQAIPILEEALEYYREVRNESFRASIWMSLGDAYSGLEEEGPDHYHLARDCYDRAWSLFERDGSDAEAELGAAQGRLGDVQLELAAFEGGQSLEKAIRHYRNALAVFIELDDADRCGTYHARLGEAYVRLSEMQIEHLRKGIRAYQRALEMFARSGNRRGEADVALELARLHEVTGAEGDPDLASAVTFYLRSLQLYGETGPAGQRAEGLRGLARIYLTAESKSDPRDLDQGIRCLEEAVRLVAETVDAEAYSSVHAELEAARHLAIGISPGPRAIATYAG